ncbi:MAG: EamA family transporter [Clostridia bacterium]|nr:EamA family transporter [Clostridia bacterium]
MYATLLFLTVLFSWQSLFCKLFSDNAKCKDKAAIPILFTVLYGGFIAISTFCVAGFRFSPSSETLSLGAINGVMLFLYNLSLIKASSQGSYAFTMIAALFGGCSLPLITQAVLWGERLSSVQWIGIVVMFISFIVINADSLSLKGAKKTFFAWCACLFLANGCYGSLMGSHQQILPNLEQKEMIIVTFVVAAAIAFAFLGITQKKETFNCFKVGKKSGIYGAICVVVASVAANLLLYLLANMSVSIVNVVTNGGTLLLSIIYAFILFREKPSFMKACGMVLSLGGIVLLSL